jgi:sterol desaturase/sphingolipid hydroxylase (fatty acid hydroxylase superfamily)
MSSKAQSRWTASLNWARGRSLIAMLCGTACSTSLPAQQAGGPPSLDYQTHLIEALKNYYHNIPGGLQLQGKSFLLFVGIAALYYLLKEAITKRFSRRECFALVFPHRFLHPSTRPEIYDHLLQTVCWGPFYIAVFGTLGTIGSAAAVQLFLVGHLGARSALLHSPVSIIAVQFAAIVLWQELLLYADHYAWHKVPFLWAFHRTHHSAESPTIFSSNRAHPIEGCFTSVAMLLAGSAAGVMLFLLGTGLRPGTVAAVAMLDLVFGPCWLYLLHSRVRISGGPVAYIFNTPSMHQIHHSMVPRHRDKNLGARLTLFDWLFGTLYVPVKGEILQWGLNEEEMGPNNPHLRLKDYYLEPFRYAARVLRGRRTHQRPRRADPVRRDGR